MSELLRPGVRFGGYQIEEHIGRGGMANVYRAEHLHLRRQVALKIPIAELADSVFRERFLRESRAVAGLAHPHLITIYDAGEIEGVPFLAMQFVEGTDLAGVLAREGALAPARTAEIVSQVAGALDVAHARGLVHRDVKPANVLIDGSQCFLADFGLTKLADSSQAQTASGEMLGSVPYAAPEQIEGGALDRRADIYALGCMAFECLVGRRPFEGSSVAVIFAHISEPPPHASVLRPELPPGVDEVIVRAMAKAPGERFDSAGEFAGALRAVLDGGPAPIAAPAPIVRKRVPLPGLLQRSERKGLVGRGELLASLSGSLDRDHAILCLVGEPGIGKTHLAAHVAAGAHEHGATVLYGRAEEDAIVPYEPFIEALRHYCVHSDVLALRTALGTRIDALAPLIPELEPLATGTLPSERYHLFEAVVNVLSHAGQAGPVVLVLEDLHWADKETLLLVRHVLRADVPFRLGAVLTYRELDLDVHHPLREILADLHRHSDMQIVELQGLSDAETAELAGSRAGRDVSSQFGRLLREQTSGNPFFIEELVRGGGETGTIGTVSGDSLTAVPPAVRRVIERRLERLDRETRDLLAVAAMLGREFRLAVLAAVTSVRSDALLDAVEEAIGIGVLAEHPEAPDRFLFCHALVRDVLTAQTTAMRRRRLHATIAAGLEKHRDRLGVEPGELALHFYEARELGLQAEALRYSIEAARRDAAGRAHEHALRHLTRALSVLDEGEIDPAVIAELGGSEPELRCELLIEKGLASWRASEPGVRDAFIAAAELARSTGSASQLARAALGLGGRFYAPVPVNQGYVDLLREALAALDDGSVELRARILARLAESVPGEQELAREALAIAGDEPTRLAALAGLHSALLDIDHVDERVGLARERVALADRLGDLEDAALGRHWLLFDLFELGEHAVAHGVFMELEELDRRLGQPLYRHSVLAWRGVFALLEGRTEEAANLALQSLALAEAAGDADARAHFLAQLLMVRRAQGREAELLGELRTVIERSFWLDGLGAALPGVLLAAGDSAGASQALAALDPEALPRGPFRLTALARLADAAAALDDTVATERLHVLLEPYAERHVQALATGSLGPVRARL